MAAAGGARGDGAAALYPHDGRSCFASHAALAASSDLTPHELGCSCRASQAAFASASSAAAATGEISVGAAAIGSVAIGAAAIGAGAAGTDAARRAHAGFA